MAKARAALLLILALLATAFPGMNTAQATDIDIPTVNKSVNAIQISENQVGDIQPGRLITVALPDGSSYVTNPSQASASGKAAYYNIPGYIEKAPGKELVLNGLQPGDVSIDSTSTEQTLVLKIVKRSFTANPAVINLCFASRLTHSDQHLGLIIDGDSHLSLPDDITDLKVNIRYDSAPEKIDVRILPAGTFAYPLSCPTVQPGEQKLGGLRIVENIEGALVPDGNEGAGTITLSLPKGIKWNKIEATPSGGFASISKVKFDTDPSGCSRASFTITLASVGNSGIIDILPFVNIDTSLPQGDIIAAIGGTNAHLTPASVLIGRLRSRGITCELAGQTTIYAGCTDARIGTLVLRESSPGSLVEGRVIYLELPAGCKWVAVPRTVTTRGSCTLTGNGIVNSSNGQIVSYTVTAPSTDGVESVIEFRNGSVSVPLGFPAGDFYISFGGISF